LQQPRNSSDIHRLDYEEIEMRDIRKTFNDSEVCDYTSSAKSIGDVIAKVGRSQIATIMLYNYPSKGALQVLRACRDSRVPTSLDLTEWYGWEGRRIARNIFRVIDSEFRMRLLSRKVGNVICASSYLEKKLAPRNSFVLPFSIDPTEQKWSERRGISLSRREPLRFIYSGSPGLGMFKDLLPEIINGFSLLEDSGKNFVFDVLGISNEQYLDEMPAHHGIIKRLGTRVKFHGRVDHEAVLDNLSKAHYAIFVRKPTRNTTAGFPTKYAEATSLGIPVITNLTSDLRSFLHHLENGIVVKDYTGPSVYEALCTAFALDWDSYLSMRECQTINNPFKPENWKEGLQVFMDRLR